MAVEPVGPDHHEATRAGWARPRVSPEAAAAAYRRTAARPEACLAEQTDGALVRELAPGWA